MDVCVSKFSSSSSLVSPSSLYHETSSSDAAFVMKSVSESMRLNTVKTAMNETIKRLAARAYMVLAWTNLRNFFCFEESSLAQTVSQEFSLGLILSSLEKSI